MKYIVDMSKFQPSWLIRWSVFSKYIDFLILRVQFGSSSPDSQYTKHVANAKKYNLPFYTYAFPAFVSVDDARVEARNAFKRQDSESLGIAIDIEPSYSKNKPTAITKLSKRERLAGLRAYVDELHKLGQKRIGAYVANHIYGSWGIDEIIDIFDWVWIPSYGKNDGTVIGSIKPDHSCDLWQYTSNGKIPGYLGKLDLNTLNGNKSLDWFLGKESNKEQLSEVIPTPPPQKEMSYMEKFQDMFEQALEELRKKPVSTWAEKEWNEATTNGYFDGTAPQGLITRQETASVINDLRHNFKGLFAEMDNHIKELDKRVTELEK